jgi:ubiquinone/menaquinone biosynthesis C-methylase UbiE
MGRVGAMTDQIDPLDGPDTSAAAWDRVWSSHSYRLDRIRSERARIKIAAAIAVGMEFADSDRVLDLACGSGHTLIEAVGRSSRQARFFGLDISAVALERARKNFERIRLDAELVRAQWPRLPFRSGAIDKVIAFMAPFPAVIREIERVLAPGGKLFMVALSRDSVTSAFYRVRESILPGPFHDRRNYSARALVSALGQSLVVEEWRIMQSGSDRPFSGALDRVIARWVSRWGRYVVVRCAKQCVK